MARFYRINIEDIYLTKTGLVDGLPCKVDVDGVDALRMDYLRTIEPSNNNTPIVQTFVYSKGKPLVITINTLMESVGEALITLFNDAMADSETVTVTGTGGTGDFTAECEFISFNFKEFNNDRWLGATIRLVTV